MNLKGWCLLAALTAPASAVQHVTEFDDPPVEHRPKFRYWLPDASVDHAVLADDVRQLKQVGAGGLEFVPFYNYGFGGPHLNQSDVYAFGKPAFAQVFRQALEAVKADGLIMDFALGASQGQGVPAEPLTPGLAMQLVYGKMTIKGGEQFQGELPAPNIEWNEEAGFVQPQERFGGNRLVGVSAGAIKYANQSGSSAVALVEESLVDLSGNVTGGRLTWQAPTDHDDYVLFAIYERYTNQRSAAGVPYDVIANGSWVTDHFSAAGAKLVSEFWEQNILSSEISELLDAVGQHSWEDSMEIQASLYWSPGFIQKFKETRGYDPVKYLPLMFDKSTSFMGHVAPYNTTYYLEGSADAAQAKYLQDYRLILNQGYVEYLQALGDWAKSLGLSHSCQVAYNIPVDMLAAVPSVAGPELESLAFTDVDQMLQFTGPAHLARRNVISTEVGAVQSGAYSQSLPSLLRLFNQAFAGGVNLMVIHGMPYGGEQPETTWPGYTPFQYVYSEMWGPRQPAWKYMSEMMGYTARNQHILQLGVAKKDLAVYLYKDHPYSTTVSHNGTDLRADGFSYEYLSPANFASENATVQGRLLDPTGSGYRALVLNQQTFISPEASTKLAEFAKAGLPIVVVGTLPNTTIGSVGQDMVSKTIAGLQSAGHANLKFIDSPDSLVQALHELSVKPRVQTSPARSAQTLHTIWRADGASNYVFLYNDGPAATFNVGIEANDDLVPSKLDAWTGSQEPVAIYGRSEGRITLSVSLRQDQATILAFTPSVEPRDHISAHSQNVAEAFYSPDGEISVAVSDAGAASVTLSDGRTHQIPALADRTGETLASIEVGPWNLTLESWVPGADATKSAPARETLDLGTQSALVPWSQVPAAQNVSGVGIYTATFTRPAVGQLAGEDVMTMMDFGPVLNTLRAWVNDKQLPAVDVSAAQVDISPYVVSGQNSVRVEVASTLFNAVKARIDGVKNFGLGPNVPQFYTAVDWQRHGLVGPVQVTTLRRVSL
ncbi:hypothetical protein PpBr36_02246 [Pyricularia pennisetigena]|uniref:hypothetical protein n=1 Tax=Pyricularia pennisetigena TaxID=1578925 RepID=UPI001151D5BA|nr:hypothetical protein PpBr36_02246 [Pyricularia pennisetigena]TLS30036.1 hypothetical protein PpBr36_02246 [Pyricularia pennisetigena]